MKKQLLAVLIGASLAGVAAPAFAITDEEGNASIQFAFVPPGARSLGMGGAFVGRADDATAAYTNPAGLTQLSQFEIGVEGRRVGYDSVFVSGGTFEANPFDTSGLEYSSAEDDANSLAYLSVVWPHDNWSIAFYRHELVKYQTSFALLDDTVAPTDANIGALLPFGAAIDIDIVNYGLSGAWEFSDAFSVGASIIYSDFELESATVRPTAGFGSAQVGDDDDIAFNVGALWKFAEAWSLGAVYRDGPDFDMDALLFGIDDAGNPTVSATGFPRSTDFTAPSVFGLGVSFQPSPAWIITFDANRVYYSDLTDDIISGFRPNDTIDPQSTEPLSIDDGTELRLGAEYTFIDSANLWALRGGVWRDPEHTIRFNGQPDTNPQSNALSNAVLFSTGDDEMHYTFGVGAVFGKFQIDAAMDFSENIDIFSISGVVRFD
jgi:long-subunit fatty acid transport protein